MKDKDKRQERVIRRNSRTGRNLSVSTGPREDHSPLAQFFTPTSQCTSLSIFEVCNFGIEMPLVSEDTS